ncbi:YkgB family protein [Halomonas sp. GXIMD04776]|uniref:YkgB family protein n=1 Tax=Halomonas sp. GXIMD04776 TaxID=3415605 RepID=UPI003C8FB209
MNTQTINPNRSATASALSVRLTTLGETLMRYSIVVVLSWIGAMKFTGYEAGATEGLVASSPFTAWLYGVLSLQATSNLIGFIEIATAAALIAGTWSARVAVIGAAAATFTFLLTSSFLITAPVWEVSLGGAPALSVLPGQFLLKDLVLLAATFFLLGRALSRLGK